MYYRLAAIIIFAVLLSCTAATAHFAMLIPSGNSISPQNKIVELSLSFSHPFEGTGMDMERPEKFYLLNRGKKTSLLDSLEETVVMGYKAWQSSYQVERPGVYHFAVEPAPYWEPSEDVFIIHYAKSIVAAFGAAEGWDEAMGLPTEIIPLLRPFGNYAGNTFTGRILLHGKPVPAAEVEVEFYNKDVALAAPSDHHVTQVVKADEQGVFSFTCPRVGWWGFAALSDADYTLKTPGGEAKTVELGAVLWVYMDEYLEK